MNLFVNASKTVGLLLMIFGALLGAGIALWLLAGRSEGDLEISGLILGLILLFGAVVLPLVGTGFYLYQQGARQAQEAVHLNRQRDILDAISTQGEVSIPELAVQMQTNREVIESDVRTLTGLGVFSGYIDWDRCMLYSVDAQRLQGMSKCPNCGGDMTMAGKGVIKCRYCGAEVFLS